MQLEQIVTERIICLVISRYTIADNDKTVHPIAEWNHIHKMIIKMTKSVEASTPSIVY